MQPVEAPPSTVCRTGLYAAIATSALTLFTFIIALLTPPISGPSCPKDCITYPYADIADRFPRDYYWMFPAMLLTLAFVVLMASIHAYAAPDRQIFSLIGLSLALLAAGALLVDYFVQVSVIQPSVENGETDGIALLTQYNAHGLFIALEEIGYLLMSLALLCLAAVFRGASRAERAIRWTVIAGFVLTVIALVGISMTYGTNREYRLEIFSLSIDWIVLIVLGFPLTAIFRRGLAASSP